MTHLRMLGRGKGTTSRRQLLRALGVSAAAAPFIPALDGWAAPAPIKRLLTVFSPHGIIPENYWPSGSETAFTFAPGSILEPMKPHQADMIIFKGLVRATSGPGDHERCAGNLWTGTTLAPGSQDASGPSIDQIVAKALNPPTDFQSVQFGAQTSWWGEGDVLSRAGSPNTSLIYADARARIYPELDPEKQFARLFAGGTAPSAMADSGAIARTRAEGKSIIDYVAGEIAELQPRLAVEDRAKIDAHLALTRDLERRLQMPAKSCGAVEMPAGGIDLGKNDNLPAIITVMNKLLVAALACDRTRVASMQYSRSFSLHKHTWVGAKDAHHTLSHNTGMKPILTTIQRWYMTQVSDLLTQMKAVSEAGGTLLDNTLVVYGSELCTPWDHNAAPPPNLFIGKAGGALKGTGRYLDFTGKNDHNQFLVTIAQAMGVTSVTKVGNVGGTGPLPGVLTG
jgi:hypothetical protein